MVRVLIGLLIVVAAPTAETFSGVALAGGVGIFLMFWGLCKLKEEV